MYGPPSRAYNYMNHPKAMPTRKGQQDKLIFANFRVRLVRVQGSGSINPTHICPKFINELPDLYSHIPLQTVSTPTYTEKLFLRVHLLLKRQRQVGNQRYLAQPEEFTVSIPLYIIHFHSSKPETPSVDPIYHTLWIDRLSLFSKHLFLHLLSGC